MTDKTTHEKTTTRERTEKKQDDPSDSPSSDHTNTGMPPDRDGDDREHKPEGGEGD